MSSLLTEFSERARHLPPEERAQLAEGLLESLQEWSSPEVEAGLGCRDSSANRRVRARRGSAFARSRGIC